MARPFVFQQIAKAGRTLGYLTPRDSYRATSWFQKTARQVASVNVDRLMDGTPTRHQTRLTPGDIGHMFMFVYDAKHKDTLPYWDRFPLCLPFHVARDHFKGFNLHYLSPYRRAQVLNELHKISMGPGTDVQKMQVSYSMLANVARLAPLGACIKMYLTGHVRSRFMWIKPDEWDVAIGLPTARFVGASATKVHRESAKRVGYRSSRKQPKK